MKILYKVPEIVLAIAALIFGLGGDLTTFAVLLVGAAIVDAIRDLVGVLEKIWSDCE